MSSRRPGSPYRTCQGGRHYRDHADVVDEPWFATGKGRAEHADELDAAVAAWVGERTENQPDPGSVLVVYLLETVAGLEHSEPGSTLS